MSVPGKVHSAPTARARGGGGGSLSFDWSVFPRYGWCHQAREEVDLTRWHSLLLPTGSYLGPRDAFPLGVKNHARGVRSLGAPLTGVTALIVPTRNLPLKEAHVLSIVTRGPQASVCF